MSRRTLVGLITPNGREGNIRGQLTRFINRVGEVQCRGLCTGTHRPELNKNGVLNEIGRGTKYK